MKTTNKPMIRQTVKQMVADGISPVSIVFAHGHILTPDERDYLEKYNSYRNQNNEDNQ